jgi:hypothetical protein
LVKRRSDARRGARLAPKEIKMIDRVQWSTGDASGSAGSATATGYSPHVAGEVLAVHVAYVDSPPSGTTDVTISDEADPASEAIVSLVDAATDIKLYPRRVTEKNDGTDILYTTGEEVYEPYVVHGRLEAVIAGANSGDSATITAWIRS